MAVHTPLKSAVFEYAVPLTLVSAPLIVVVPLDIVVLEPLRNVDGELITVVFPLKVVRGELIVVIAPLIRAFAALIVVLLPFRTVAGELIVVSGEMIAGI